MLSVHVKDFDNDELFCGIADRRMWIKPKVYLEPSRTSTMKLFSRKWFAAKSLLIFSQRKLRRRCSTGFQLRLCKPYLQEKLLKHSFQKSCYTFWKVLGSFKMFLISSDFQMNLLASALLNSCTENFPKTRKFQSLSFTYLSQINFGKFRNTIWQQI